MAIKIVVDSSADMMDFEGAEFAYAPLKIITADKEYVDNKDLDVEEMVRELYTYNGKSSTACRALCSFYAERGGLLLGYEKA